MKKILFVVMALFILTGCSATYNLEIYDDKVVESSDFLLEKNDDNDVIVDTYYNTNYLAFFDMDSLEDHNYSKERIDDGKHVGMNLNFVYVGTDYEKSSLLDKCYYKKSFTKTDDYIILYTEGGAGCFYQDQSKLLDDLTINIKTDLDVVDNNADKRKGNVYTWKLTSENFSEKDIYIKIKRASKNSYISLIILSVVVIVGIVVLIIRKYNNNKI